MNTDLHRIASRLDSHAGMFRPTRYLLAAVVGLVILAPTAQAAQFGPASSMSGAEEATQKAISVSLSAWNGWTAAPAGTSISVLSDGVTLTRFGGAEPVMDVGTPTPDQLPGSAVPEPSAALLFAAGLVVSGAARRRRA